MRWKDVVQKEVGSREVNGLETTIKEGSGTIRYQPLRRTDGKQKRVEGWEVKGQKAIIA
jgi:hypothetical protein